MPYISLFFILLSVAGLVTILGLKVGEVKTGKSEALVRLNISIGPIVRRNLLLWQGLVEQTNIANLRKMFSFATDGMFHIFGTFGLVVAKQYSRFKKWVGGRKYIKGRGVVSFFLRNVAESKGEKKDM